MFNKYLEDRKRLIRFESKLKEDVENIFKTEGIEDMFDGLHCYCDTIFISLTNFAKFNSGLLEKLDLYFGIKGYVSMGEFGIVYEIEDSEGN